MRKITDHMKSKVRSINANLELDNYQYLSDLEANVKELLVLIQRENKEK